MFCKSIPYPAGQVNREVSLFFLFIVAGRN